MEPAGGRRPPRRRGQGAAKAEPRLLYLIRKVERGRVAEGEELAKEDLPHNLAAVRVLEHILDMHDFKPASKRNKIGEIKAELVRRQGMMLKLGAVRIAIMFASSEHPQLCEYGLVLATKLLRGGNPDVQAAFMDFVSNPLVAQAIRPFDGTSSPFLDRMRDLLRLAMVEVHDERIYRAQQADRLEHFDEEARENEWSEATKAVMHAEICRPFPTRAFALDLLETLRLLCEGHNTAMQDLLREQSGSASSARIDLVTEIATLLVTLEPNIDEFNIDIVIKCVETLTEMCQGNESMGNAKQLCDGKVIGVAERLVLVKTLRGVEDDKLNELRSSVIQLLMAMLEGIDRSAERVMLRTFDIPAIAKMLDWLYDNKREVEEDDSEEEEEAEEEKKKKKFEALTGGVKKGFGGAAKMASSTRRRRRRRRARRSSSWSSFRAASRRPTRTATRSTSCCATSRTLRSRTRRTARSRTRSACARRSRTRASRRRSGSTRSSSRRARSTTRRASSSASSSASLSCASS